MKREEAVGEMEVGLMYLRDVPPVHEVNELEEEVMQIMHDLAGMYMALDRSAEAWAVSDAVFASKTKTLGPDHPDNISTEFQVGTNQPA